MDEKDQKNAETASTPQVEAVEIADGDLEVVTGGLISRITEGPPTDPCITSIG
jgi:hypothetical protein